MNIIKIAVIDGQGGKIGKLIVEKLKGLSNNELEIIVLGTNSLATSTMLKGGATKGATGENAIVLNASRVDYIIGPIAIVLANSMLGEVTPKMADAIASSTSKKMLIPLERCNVHIVGVGNNTVAQLINKLTEELSL